MNINKRIQDLGLTLAESNAPGGSYLPYKIIDNLLYISGQTTRRNGKVLYAGRLGADFDIEEGREAAKLCLENVLCHVYQACESDLNRIKAVVRIGVYVQCTESFIAHPQIADSASELLISIFGEKGKHVRTSIGANSLPGNTAVEIDAVFEITH